MTITNLTVTDKGEIVEVSYIMREGNTGAYVEQQILKSEFHRYKAYTGKIPAAPDCVMSLVNSYLNQNLK